MSAIIDRSKVSRLLNTRSRPVLIHEWRIRHLIFFIVIILIQDEILLWVYDCLVHSRRLQFPFFKLVDFIFIHNFFEIIRRWHEVVYILLYLVVCTLRTFSWGNFSLIIFWIFFLFAFVWINGKNGGGFRLYDIYS